MSIAAELNSCVVSTRQRLGTRRANLVFFSGLTVVGLFLSLRDFFSYQLGYPPDSVQYRLLARILIDDSFAAHLASTGVGGNLNFPFGFPMLLTPLVIGFPQSDWLPQILSLVATFVNAALLFWGWRWLVPRSSRFYRYAVTSMTLLAPLSITQSRLVLSEAIFTTTLLLALIFAARLLATPANRRLWFALSVACFFLVFIRTVGWVFCGAIVLYLAVALRGRAVNGLVTTAVVMFVLAAIVVALAPQTLGTLLPQRYFSQYGASTQRIVLGGRGLANPPSSSLVSFLVRASALLRLHLEDLRRVLFLSGGGDALPSLAQQLQLSWLVALPATLVFILLTLGNLEWIRRTRLQSGSFISLFQFAALCYLVPIVIWDGSGDRLYYPIQPQLFFALLLSGAAGWRIITRVVRSVAPRDVSRRLVQPPPALLVVIFFTGWLGLALWRDVTLRTSYEMWGDLNQRTEWLRDNIPSNAILASDWEALDFYRTGHDAYSIPRADSADELLNKLHDLNASYLVLAADSTLAHLGNSTNEINVRLDTPYLRELIRRGQLIPIYSNSLPLQIWHIAP